MTVPKIMEMIESLSGRFIKAAIIAPVHAPVPGSGIAIKRNRPNRLYFVMDLLFFSSFVSSLSMNFTKRVFFISSNNFRMNKKIKGIGTRVPAMQIGSATCQFTPSKLAAKIPPLSSKMGNIEIRKTMILGPNVLSRISTNDLTIESKQFTPLL